MPQIDASEIGAIICVEKTHRDCRAILRPSTISSHSARSAHFSAKVNAGSQEKSLALVCASLVAGALPNKNPRLYGPGAIL